MNAPFSTPVSCAVTFLAAAVTDALLLWWFTLSARGQRGRAAVLSMVLAMTALMGFGEALSGFWPGVTYVLGYGAGTWIAITLNRKQGVG